MDLHWLDDVLVLLEESNMTRAAARRHITQPAFSRRIRGFEDWVGATVLDRQSNSVIISDALRASEPEIRALLGRIRELRGRIRQHDPAKTTVSIAAQHAPIFSTFPDMALYARRHFPALGFRLRPGNLRDCVSMFLRGDSQILLCYESPLSRPMPFGEDVRRVVWGRDFLVPVIGGALRYSVRDDGSIPEDTSAVVYPEDSYFGEVLGASDRPFATPARSVNPICETALSSGIKQMVLSGLGVGWLPFSMAHREIESGDMISLSNTFGKEELEIAFYADMAHPMAKALTEVWREKRR
jgi:DNA-binding transcriptional LysR family regulator